MIRKTPLNNLPGSYRDPDGHLFIYKKTLYRQVSISYQPHYDLLLHSGLYDHLVKSHQLISHREVKLPVSADKNTSKIIQPETIPFISYPYEWCFSQLKKAALLTLDISRQALDYGMILKDASAFNIQFLATKPVFIDTLSFEKYLPDQPWIAYQQFCRHFLAPLALMSYQDLRLNRLLQIYPDGLPLEMTSTLLPSRTKLNLNLLSHIHIQSYLSGYAKLSSSATFHSLKLTGLKGILENLKKTIQNLSLPGKKTVWENYYQESNYLKAAFTAKKTIVSSYLKSTKPKNILDLGANTGTFSALAAGYAPTIALDNDPKAVELNYQRSDASNLDILPLVIDLTNPSPGLGFAETERDSFLQRSTSIKTCLVLALLHHSAITHNIPLDLLASFFRSLAENLIIEFIPKTDSNCQKLLQSRKDIFSDYTQEGFENAFFRLYRLISRKKITGSDRVLYLLKAGKR